MVIGPNAAIHSRVKNITLLLYSEQGGDVSISVDKPGLTPRTPSFTALPLSKTPVIFDIHNTNTVYTVTATDDDGSDDCTVSVQAQCTTGIDLGDVENEIEACMQAIRPVEGNDPDTLFTFQTVILEQSEQFTANKRAFNFPLQGFGHGEILGSRFGEYLLQVSYPDSVTGAEIQMIMDAIHSYQWSSGILTVQADSGTVEYFEDQNTAILSLRLYALYNAIDE